MNKLTREEVTDLMERYAKGKTSKAHRILHELAQFAVGESGHITTEEWPLPKSRPSAVFSAHFKQSGRRFKVRELGDNMGWVVTRIL